MARKALPARLVEQLARAGVMTRDRVSERPAVRHCKRCGAAVVSALVDGVRVDLAPRRLTALGELQALRVGLCTYELARSWARWRSHVDIRCSSADVRHVHASHRCGAEFDYWPLPARQPAAKEQPAGAPGEQPAPPF